MILLVLKIGSFFYDARSSHECAPHHLDTQRADLRRNNRGRCVKKTPNDPEPKLVTEATKCGMGPSSALLLAAFLGKRFLRDLIFAGRKNVHFRVHVNAAVEINVCAKRFL